MVKECGAISFSHLKEKYSYYGSHEKLYDGRKSLLHTGKPAYLDSFCWIPNEAGRRLERHS
jgi:hypothetical protein